MVHWWCKSSVQNGTEWSAVSSLRWRKTAIPSGAEAAKVGQRDGKTPPTLQPAIADDWPRRASCIRQGPHAAMSVRRAKSTENVSSLFFRQLRDPSTFAFEVHNTVCPTSYGDSFRGTSQRDEVRMNIPELLTCKEVMDMTGIKSRTTIWRRIQSGRFPHPIDFDGGRIRWRAQDIADWVNSRPLRRY